jgi:DNA-binding response OmpR family regulator
VTHAILSVRGRARDPALPALVARRRGLPRVESENARARAIDAGRTSRTSAIVDLALPDLDGKELIGQIRGWYVDADRRALGPHPGALRRSTRSTPARRLHPKPFGVGELWRGCASACATRRARRPGRCSRSASEGRLDKRRAWRGTSEVHLTPIEFSSSAAWRSTWRWW